VKALALLLLLGVAGCTLGDDRVSRACKSSSDCFQAQGETCNVSTHQCEAPIQERELSDDAPDAGVAPDAAGEAP